MVLERFEDHETLLTIWGLEEKLDLFSSLEKHCLLFGDRKKNWFSSVRLLCTSLLHSSRTNGRHKLSEMVRAIPFFFPLSPQTFCATFCKNFPRENIGFATTAISPWTLVIYGPATGGHVTPEYEKLFSYIGFLQTWHSDIHNIHKYF